ncbi:MAG TPA: efflux RND transporter periplasmic adaptor subunit [Thermoanaerobaculia bacterium]|nr:efflux RND transporter periplasmic adaptor subunit [Thermoanaerobaculia bacterium]
MRRTTTIILLAAAVLSCRGRGKQDEQYKTEKASRGDVTMTVTATGTLSAVTTVQVGSQVSGVISRLYADFNSHVKKGQLLAELDPTPFQQTVEQRQADVTKSQVEAANAKITYDRQRRLTAAGLAAQADLDSAKTAYEGAQAQVAQSRAALSQAETNLKYAKIVSPIDGVVVDRAYDVGQTVAASFQAPTLFQIAQDLTKMQVQADVDQSDIGRIQVGQFSRFTVDSYPDEMFRGRISQIRLNATVSQNVVTYPVIIEVPNPDEKLRPKMTANVTISVARVQNVLRIPNASLRFRPEGVKEPPATTSSGGQTASNAPNQNRDMAQLAQSGAAGPAGAAGAFGRGHRRGGPQEKKQQTIYILDANKKPQPVEIRTGITDGRYTEVVEGTLKEGQDVIVGLATSKVDSSGATGSPFGGGGRPGGRGR